MTPNSLKLSVVAVLATLVIGCGSGSDDTVTNPAPNALSVAAPAAVYTMTNDQTANAIREYRRNTNGTLTFVADYPTNGRGSGDGLNGSTNALHFDSSTNRFYAVNAGDNTITAMSLATDGKLSALSTLSSGGIRPISVTAFGDLIYVLNAGDGNVAANISGFRLTGGQLTALEGSTRALSAANPNPAQIEFAPNGTILVVTERDTNLISTFNVGSNGKPQSAQAQASNGKTPFGFDFTNGGVLIVSEAQAAAVGASTLSSYDLGADGKLTTISNSVPSGQTAACWMVVNRFAPYAYVTNTAVDSISIYQVDLSGELSLPENGDSAATGDAPVDLAISSDGQFLYTLNTGDDSISVYSIGSEGRLTPTTGVDNLPANSVGLVAR